MTLGPRKPYSEDSIPEKWMSLSEAKKRIMDYVAQRDHSEAELSAKLKPSCEEEVIEQAMAWAQKQNWFVTPEVLKDKLAEQLHRKGKGIRSINQNLEAKGLPPAQSDFETEIIKARKLVLNRWSNEDFKELDFTNSQKLKTKIMRFLITRGFEADIVQQILKNDLKAGALSHDEE